MNKIEKIRADVKNFFDPKNILEECNEVLFSPNANYRVNTNVFKQNKPACDWNIAKVEIFDNSDNKLLFVFFVNDGTFFHSWVSKNNTDYLLCAEDLCGGQTVIDLTNRKISSYTEDNDGFIWTKHILSPDEKLLAVFGCGWGSPFFTVIYYFDQPLELPLKIAVEPNWTGYDIIEWLDNNTLRVKNTPTEEALLHLKKSD